MSQQILIARPQHASIIARFQISMALQTQNFKLDPQIVEKAVSYLISLRGKSQSSQLGFYLVKQINGKMIASLLLTFECTQRWWIQSVYVQKQYRRQGHFTSLFNKAIQIAKQKGVKSVKLYAQTENSNAKQTYFKLGMSLIEGKIYSYDFVYGGSTLHKEGHQQYQFFESNHQHMGQISKWLEQKQNKLSKGKDLIQSNKGLVVIIHDQKLMGVVRYFEQFSDWRFGIMRYVRQIYLDQSCSLEEIVSKLTSYLVTTSQIKVAARIAFSSVEGRTFIALRHTINQALVIMCMIKNVVLFFSSTTNSLNWYLFFNLVFQKQNLQFCNDFFVSLAGFLFPHLDADLIPICQCY